MLIFEVRLSGFPSRCVVTAAADVAVDASPGCFFPLLRLPTLPFVVFATRFRSNLVDVVIVVVVVVASFVFISPAVVVLIMIIIFLFARIDEITDLFGAAASTAFRRFRFFFLLLLPLLSPFPVLLSFATTMLTMMMTTRMTTMTTSTAARGSPSSSLLFRHVGLWQIDKYKDSLGKERSRQTSTSISVSA